MLIFFVCSSRVRKIEYMFRSQKIIFPLEKEAKLLYMDISKFKTVFTHLNIV